MVDGSLLGYQRVYYFINNFTLMANGKSFTVPWEKIGNMEIIKRFDTDLYPYYSIWVDVPSWFYGDLVNDASNVKANMSLQYKLFTDDDVDKKGAFTTEISGVFTVDMPNTNNISDTKLQTNIQDTLIAKDKTYTANDARPLKLLLYNTLAWKMSFTNINAVLTSTNMTDALGYCLTVCGMKNVLLETANNSRRYSEFKIMPESAIKNILRIIEDYNFHNAGSVVFFDLVQSYILSKTIGCKVWLNNEFTCTRIESLSEFSDNLSTSGGVLFDTKNKINIIAAHKDAIKADKLDNSPLLRKEENQFLSFRLSDVVLSMLTPNKDIVVSLQGDMTKYCGRYRIHSVNTNLIKNGKYYTTDTLLILKR